MISVMNDEVAFQIKEKRSHLVMFKGRELQRASESFRELQRATIDGIEELMQSFNFSKMFLSSCKPFPKVSLILNILWLVCAESEQSK